MDSHINVIDFSRLFYEQTHAENTPSLFSSGMLMDYKEKGSQVTASGEIFCRFEES